MLSVLSGAISLAERFADVMAMLSEYGLEDWQLEADRVRLAVLKLAAGSIERLRYEIEGAKADYRDVLGPPICGFHLSRCLVFSSRDQFSRDLNT